jgi:hypothetical protein
MNMDDLTQVFEERLQEIEAYLDFLEAVDEQVQEGTPRLGGNGAAITIQQQKILYSSVYLQLYNLVESTVTRCLNAISVYVVNSSLRPDDLSIEMRKEWVRCIARTHTDLNYENRLESAMNLCNYFLSTLPISEDFILEKGGGGNWDDQEILKLSRRLGLSLTITTEVYNAVKRPIRNDMGTLALIKDYRNKLAHGSLSFVECGENTTAYELRQLTNRVALYMREVVVFFKSSMDTSELLAPERRH